MEITGSAARLQQLARLLYSDVDGVAMEAAHVMSGLRRSLASTAVREVRSGIPTTVLRDASAVRSGGTAQKWSAARQSLDAIDRVITSGLRDVPRTGGSDAVRGARETVRAAASQMDEFSAGTAESIDIGAVMRVPFYDVGQQLRLVRHELLADAARIR